MNSKLRSSRLTTLNLESPSRFHPIKDLSKRHLVVLRDDELGGFWGTKFRKYASIIEFCKKQRITDVIATGGINSNNLAAAAALLTEAHIKLHAFAILDHSDDPSHNLGNRMLIRLIIPKERLHLIPRSEKSNVVNQMSELAHALHLQNRSSLVLEEGGGCEAAVPGCLTLADNLHHVVKTEMNQEIPDNIFIDSGTALTSASLLARLKQLNLDSKTKVHVIQMAGYEEQLVQAFTRWVTPTTGVDWNDVSHFVRVYRPMSPRSYGATSQELFSFIKYMAETQGILCDPVYSAKLFKRAFDLIEGQNCRGSISIIHTGGVSGLMGHELPLS
jgi:1-aminocyclopropane-1-carboxylate deaminase